MSTRRALLLAGAAAWTGRASGYARPPLRVGPTRAVQRIADAARLAVDGDLVEIDAGDYVADVAVWDRADLTLRAVGGRVRLLAAGAHAEGKAIWVVRRGRVVVEGVDFIGARVPHLNGAGIRFEGGELTVRDCSFIDNQMGLLTANEPSMSLRIERCEFGHAARNERFTHLLYAGAIGELTVVGSYFHHGDNGHLLKSRARRNRIEYSRFTDEPGGRGSYEINLPNGGRAELVGNLIQQGVGSPNAVIVSFGEEGYAAADNELVLAHNTVVNDLEGGAGLFVRAAAGPARVVTRNNLWVGPGQLASAPAVDAQGDWRVGFDGLVRPARQDYRLNPAAIGAGGWRLAGPLPPDWVPRAEYVHPRQLRPLAGLPALPGALQN